MKRGAARGNENNGSAQIQKTKSESFFFSSPDSMQGPFLAAPHRDANHDRLRQLIVPEATRCRPRKLEAAGDNSR